LRRRLELLVSAAMLIAVMSASPASSAVVVKGVAHSSCAFNQATAFTFQSMVNGTRSGWCGKVVVG
jgi:hypothetical protein